jgi:hypothetical protein
VCTPAAVGFCIAFLTPPRVVPLLGRHVLTLAYLIAALGLLATAATAAAAGSSLVGWELAPTLFITGLGQGLGMSPMVGTIIAGLEPADAGAGAGVVTTTLQTGNVLGVAGGGLLFFTLVGSGAHAAAYANAYALVLPLSAALLALAAFLAQLLPVTPFEAQNALIERLPGRATGFAYSMFLMTGGRIGDRLFADVLSHVAERRLRRTEQAPDDPASSSPTTSTRCGKTAPGCTTSNARRCLWSRAHSPRRRATGGHRSTGRGDPPPAGCGPDRHRARCAAGAAARVVLASYPRLLPQVTRMTTGSSPDDPRFAREWEAFVRDVGTRLAHPGHGQRLRASRGELRAR